MARFLIKILILADFGQTWQKMAKITVFGTLRKNDSNKFSEIALKVSPKIVLQDRIVILPKKIRYWG